MWFIGVEVEQETSAPPPKKILDPPLCLVVSFEKTCKNFGFVLHQGEFQTPRNR